MLRGKEAPLSIIIILSTTIFAVTMVILTRFETIGTAQGQASRTLLTPEQKAAMCNPDNPKLKFVNGTESRICGIPKTIKPSAANSTLGNNNTSSSSSVNITTSGDNNVLLSSIAPSIIPPTPANTTTSSSSAAAENTTNETQLAAEKECESRGFSFLYCQYFHGFNH